MTAFIGGIVSGVARITESVTGSYNKKKEVKAREVESINNLRSKINTNDKEIKISMADADVINNKLAKADTQSSFKDEFVTYTVGVYFFIWPMLAAIIDAKFDAGLLKAHKEAIAVLTSLTMESAIGMVFVGIMLTAAGVTGVKAFFKR